MGLFDRLRPRSGPETFWNWFRGHEPALFEFERDQGRVFAQLAAALRNVHPDLVFEFGPVEGGRREFVVSAGGIKSAFPAVESLVECAPTLPRWRFTKFRPRRHVSGAFTLGPVHITTDRVFVSYERANGLWHLVVHLPGFTPTPEQWYEQAGYLLLDQALGEYDVETKLGSISFSVAASPEAQGTIPIGKLAALIDGAPAN
jgi:hypothetical protein